MPYYNYVGGKHVKGFERSNGLDTPLYKNYLYLLSLHFFYTRRSFPHLRESRAIDSFKRGKL